MHCILHMSSCESRMTRKLAELKKKIDTKQRKQQRKIMSWPAFLLAINLRRLSIRGPVKILGTSGGGGGGGGDAMCIIQTRKSIIFSHVKNAFISAHEQTLARRNLYKICSCTFLQSLNTYEFKKFKKSFFVVLLRSKHVAEMKWILYL